jgi:capsid protein
MEPKPCLRILDSHGNKIPLFAVVDPPFEGAATGRRMNTWGTSTVGPNTSLYSSLNRLRSRSRELIRNNPLVQGGVDSYVANAISTGIFLAGSLPIRFSRKISRNSGMSLS